MPSSSPITLITVCTMFSVARGFTTSTRLVFSQVKPSYPTRNTFSSSSKAAGTPDFLWQLFGGANEVNPGTVEGTDLRIVEYPHPALRAVNEEISEEEMKSPEIAKLARDMLKVMYAAEGVGLAAPQVGVNKRLMVYNPTGDSRKWIDEMVLLNPKIVEYSDAKDSATEGCLSFPDMQGDVTRSKWIKIHAVNLQGRPVKKKFTGWEARIFQHEYDHLDGVVYVDRLSEDGRTEVQPRLNELITQFGEGGAL